MYVQQKNLTKFIACLMIRSAWADLADLASTWETQQLFVVWMVHLLGTMRTEFWQHQFHAGVKRCVRNVSTAYGRKHLWNEMQINGNNMLRLQIWTQMRKCKRKFCIATLHFTCGNYYYQMMSWMWDMIMSHNYYSLGETLRFITITCKSSAFLIHWDVGNDCIIYRRYSHNLPYYRNVETLSLFSPLVGFMGISKYIDPAVVYLFGNGRWRQMLVLFCRCIVWVTIVSLAI